MGSLPVLTESPNILPTFPLPIYEVPESTHIQEIISTLKLQTHIEGGYFVETDRDRFQIPNPFLSKSQNPSNTLALLPHTEQNGRSPHTRAASTSIFYLLTPSRPQGAFHRNKGRTIHTLHKGRGRYVIIHADDTEDLGGKARVETFVVGSDIASGERLQWIVEGGKYKASFLLEDEPGKGESKDGLLISETVIPGFEYADHDFMIPAALEGLVTSSQIEELRWLLRKGSESR